MTFKELNLNDDLVYVLQNNNLTHPTEIQAAAIPLFLSNYNIFGKSSTGTGKTASFVLPILQRLDSTNRKVQALIIAPTRELAMQITDWFKMMTTYNCNIRLANLIGGADIRTQVRNLRDAQIVVGTPGRIQDHLNRGTLRLGALKTIILDEADEMLKMGFKNEIDKIFELSPNDTQIGLFSATMNPKVLNLAKNYMPDYKLVEIDNVLKVNQNITNTFVFTKGFNKEQLLQEVFKKHQPSRAIVFTNTKANTERIAKNLRSIGIKSVVINGDKKQTQRSKAIRQFKNKEFDVLIATDVVARGIDIDGIDYVINYDISRENENFVHRIGRTGRNNATGFSISFIHNKDTLYQLKEIQKEYKIIIDEIIPSEYNLIKGFKSNIGNEPVQKRKNDEHKPNNYPPRDKRSSERNNKKDFNRSKAKKQRNRMDNESSQPKNYDGKWGFDNSSFQKEGNKNKSQSKRKKY